MYRVQFPAHFALSSAIPLLRIAERSTSRTELPIVLGTFGILHRPHERFPRAHERVAFRISVDAFGSEPSLGGLAVAPFAAGDDGFEVVLLGVGWGGGEGKEGEEDDEREAEGVHDGGGG